MAENKQEEMEKKMSQETEKQQETAEQTINDTENNAADHTEEAGSEAQTEQEQSAEPDPLEAAQQQVAALKDQLLRTMAEFDNYKKRTIKEKAELIQNGGVQTVVGILPVLDDFERALADTSEDATAIKEGMQMIFNKFNKSLEQMGVKKIEALDHDFDTDYHEAIAMVPGMGDDKKGKVIDCVQTGYTMNEKVIRHAKVAVAE